MRVIKRNGEYETVSFDKITRRIEYIMKEANIKTIDSIEITKKVIDSVVDGVSTSKLDEMVGVICASMSTIHYEYAILAARITINNFQKNYHKTFLESVTILYNNLDKDGDPAPQVSEEMYNMAEKYNHEIEKIIDYNRDYLLDYFGFKTLEKKYLLRAGKKVMNDKGNYDYKKYPVENIQHMWMRCAIGLHKKDLDKVKETYDFLSQKYFTHATPTLFHSGCVYPQLSSCYLLGIEDSIEGIFETITDCAKISKWAGGIGVHINNIRSEGTYIKKTGGISSGILPLLKQFEGTAKYVNQSGRRPGAFAIYLEPYHPDILTFLDAKDPHKSEDKVARDLFYGLMIPDYFMECVEKNMDWYLIDVTDYKKNSDNQDLNDLYGEDFKAKYLSLVSQGKYTRKVKAVDIFKKIVEIQAKSGTPYICYKDAVNKRSNQKNIGTIKSSNLCVSGDTMILTENGYFPIKEIENHVVNVWNGDEFSETTIRKTGENQELIEVKISNGSSIKCTPYHKFYIEMSKTPSKKSRPIEIMAKDLNINDKLIRFSFPLIDGNKEMKNAYAHGLFCAEGTYVNYKESKRRCSFKCVNDTQFCKRHQKNIRKYRDDGFRCCASISESRPKLYLYDKKKELEKYIIDFDYKREYENRIEIDLPFKTPKKFFVPINFSINTRIRWLEGLFDGDGCVITLNGLKNIQLANINKEFMTNLSYLLNTLGINTRFNMSKKSHRRIFTDKKSNSKEYNCKDIYRINIDSRSILKLQELGFSPKRLNIETRKPHHITNMFYKIESITPLEKKEDTFCFNEPLKHKGIFNGILTGNCTEIMEYSDAKETSVCNLASVSLSSITYPKTFIPNGKIIIYTIDNCIWCNMAKSILKDRNLDHKVINCNENIEKYKDEIRNIIYNINLNRNSPKAERVRNTYEKNIFTDEETVKENNEKITFPQIFLRDKNGYYTEIGGYDDLYKLTKEKIDYTLLEKLTKTCVRNLDNIIDINYYPTDKAEKSNKNNRPIGVGVQGLADLFLKLKIPFTSEKAKKKNIKIFETMYYAAVCESVELAKERGKYPRFDGSPHSEGKFQFDLWREFKPQKNPMYFNKNTKKMEMRKEEDYLSGRYDFEKLREEVKKYGMRNSLLIALMPTASTSQILGNMECFEPCTSNIFVRETTAGSFTVINKYLIKDLIDMGLWNQKLNDELLYYKGSVQNIEGIPRKIKDIYKTMWEIRQKDILDMAADRSRFICQSQSLNIYVEKIDLKTMTNIHFHGWKLGLKTGSYYIRSKPSTGAKDFTTNKALEIKRMESNECESCSA